MDSGQSLVLRKAAALTGVFAGIFLSCLGGSAANAADAETDIVAYAKGKLEAAYRGTHRKPPIHAPKPVAGKSVWIISPGQETESASVPVGAAKEAGETIGWKMTVFDGHGDPSTFAKGVRQAIAAKADGIILDSIDCGWIKQALLEARRSGVKTVAYYALDCNDPGVKGAALFDGTVSFGSEYKDYAETIRAWGAVKADWVIAETQGKAKVISLKEDEFLIVKYIREGFEKELAKCKTCEIVKTVDFTLSDSGPRLAQKVQGAIAQYPQANVIHVPYDGVMFSGVATGIVQSGRKGELEVIGGEGFNSNISLIREKKGEDACNAFPSDWIGWAAVDSMNSVLNGQSPQDSGIGWQMVDRQHNMPAPGKGYEPNIDFRSAYKHAWGM